MNVWMYECERERGRERERESENVSGSTFRNLLEKDWQNIYHIGIENWNLITPFTSFPWSLGWKLDIGSRDFDVCTKWRRWKSKMKTMKKLKRKKNKNKQANKIIQHDFNSCLSLFSRFVGCKPFFDGVQVRRVSKASPVINK